MISSSGAMYFFITKNTPFSIHLIECYWKKSDQGILPSSPPPTEMLGKVVPGTVGAVVLGTVVTTAELVSTSARENSIIWKSAFS